jgi:chemotaxis family two-component system sensor kinase Cph1
MTDTLLPPGTPVDLTNCEREPIHVPGSVQPHGVLLTVEGVDGPVLQVSSGCERLVGLTAEELLGSRLDGLLDDASVAAVGELLGEERQHRVGIPLTVALRRDGAAFEALLHRSGRVWVVELEPTTDERHVAPTFHGVRDAVADLSRTNSPAELMQVAVEHVRRLTGFDRVMLYRFDREWNGEVVAEHKAPELESFLGLHYPHGDIPPQARALYRVNWLRFIRDVDAVSTPLVPVLDPTTGEPLDLSLSALRSVSPIHCQYLRNMGVTASMSISLLIDGELAGLIACHHYSGPFVPSAPVRATCEFLAQTMSLMLGARERDERLARSAETQATLASVVRGTKDVREDLSEALAPHAPALLRAVGAAGMAWTLDGRTRTAGEVPDASSLLRLREWAAEQQPADGVVHSDQVPLEAPGLADLAERASGVLAVQVAEGQDVLFLRPEAVRTVDWGGNPHLKVLTTGDDGEARLSPRGSFALWRETVEQRSRPWEDAELEAAHALRVHLVEMLFERNRALAGVAETLQRSLLPDQLPAVPEWALAADYRPASVGVGGDWYDVLPVTEGRVLLVLGDVAGHGLVAAGAMAQVRNALRAYAVEDPDPAAVLTRLDHLVSVLTPDAMATAVTVLLDPATGELEVVSAGHTAPLVLSGGTVSLMALETGPPLGAGLLGPPGNRTSSTLTLHRGEALLLVSDGMFERRDEAIDVSLDRLAGHLLDAGAAGLAPPAVLQRLVEVARPVGNEDDATLLLARRI